MTNVNCIKHHVMSDHFPISMVVSFVIPCVLFWSSGSLKNHFSDNAFGGFRYRNDGDFATQNHPQFRKKGSFRKAKAMVIKMYGTGK